MQNTVIQYFALLFSANFIKSATLGNNRSKFLLSITNINFTNINITNINITNINIIII